MPSGWLAAAPIPRTRGATPAVGRRAKTQRRAPRLAAFPQVAPPAPGSKLAGLPSGPAARWTPRCDLASQAPQAVSSLSPPDCSQRPPELSWGLPRTLSPSAAGARSRAFGQLTPPHPRTLGGGGRAAPLAGPEEKGILARVLAARNRFIWDLIPVLSGSSQAWEPVKSCRRQRGCQQVSTVYCAFPSPQDQSLPHPIWQKPQSFVIPRPFPAGPEPAARPGGAVHLREPRWQQFAWAAACKRSNNVNCLLLQTHISQ